ncbi:MAG: rubredoxin-like domain-containing protein [Pseudonocardiaceae bacterium]
MDGPVSAKVYTPELPAHARARIEGTSSIIPRARRMELVCSLCGYGIVCQELPDRCPMCGAPAAWAELPRRSTQQFA